MTSSKPKPKSTSLKYLVGWFKPDVKGNYKEAKKLALAYQEKNPCNK